MRSIILITILEQTTAACRFLAAFSRHVAKPSAAAMVLILMIALLHTRFILTWLVVRCCHDTHTSAKSRRRQRAAMRLNMPR